VRDIGEHLEAVRAHDMALDPVDGGTIVEPAQPALVEQVSLRLVRGAQDPELRRALPLVGIVAERSAERGCVRGRDRGQAAQAIGMGAGGHPRTVDPHS
jgi:hypothetical protein